MWRAPRRLEGLPGRSAERAEASECSPNLLRDIPIGDLGTIRTASHPVRGLPAVTPDGRTFWQSRGDALANRPHPRRGITAWLSEVAGLGFEWRCEDVAFLARSPLEEQVRRAKYYSTADELPVIARIEEGLRKDGGDFEMSLAEGMVLENAAGRGRNPPRG